MSNMVSHAKIAPHGDNHCLLSEQFNIGALHPFDGMKVALEQAMYAQYLDMASSTTTIDELHYNVDRMLAQLPKELRGNDTTLNGLYQSGIEIARHIQNNGPRGGLSKISPQDLFAIFYQPKMKDYIHREYLSTMTEDFLTQWVAFYLGWYNKDRYDDGILHECALYVPGTVIAQNYNPAISSMDNNAFHLHLKLTPVAMTSFDLTKASKEPACLHCFLDLFDMREYSLDDLVGILASFSIDHDQYVMTNTSGHPGPRMADVCFDLVTGSSFVCTDSAGLNRTRDHEPFFQMIRSQIERGRLKVVQDYELFGELLTKTGESSDIVNYFIKPITLISATEAYAFRSSDYATFMTDRFEPGMEALDEGLEDTNEQGGDPSEGSEESGEGTEPDDGTIPETDETGFSDENNSAEDDKPQIDPNRMLLELAQPSESMSDYIYREMVARRISYILKNPPENAMPNDLLMLKRWRSRWLYLASISCLRDFLTRVSIRLSDV